MPAGRTDQPFDEPRVDRHACSRSERVEHSVEPAGPSYTSHVLALPRPLARALRHDVPVRVLVVRLGALGDVLRTLPAVRLVGRALPRATLWWAVDDRWRAVLEGEPDLEGLVCLPRGEWEQQLRRPLSWPALGGAVRALAARLQALGADLVLDFHGNLRSGLVGWLSGAPVRLGYAGHQSREGNRFLTTHRVPEGARRTPRIERNLGLVRALGLPDAPLPLGELALVRRGAPAAERVLEQSGLGTRPFALLNPGASAAQSFKRPPAALLAAVARRLESHGLGALVVWGPREEPWAREVVDLAPGGARLAPPTDLAALAALTARARLFVGGDSGPLHLACMLGRPVLGLYGPTDPRVNGPWGVPARVVAPDGRAYSGIRRVDRRGPGCEAIEPTQVETALEDLLTEIGASPDR